MSFHTPGVDLRCDYCKKTYAKYEHWMIGANGQDRHCIHTLPPITVKPIVLANWPEGPGDYDDIDGTARRDRRTPWGGCGEYNVDDPNHR